MNFINFTTQQGKFMNPVIRVDDHVISQTDGRPTKFLGLMINEYLNWTDHIQDSFIKSVVRFVQHSKNVIYLQSTNIKVNLFC